MPISKSPRASRGPPKSNSICSAAISRCATPAAEWRRWTTSDFADMVEQTPVRTYVVEYREPSVDGRPGRLVGACLSDQQSDGLSMIYSFFDVGPGARRKGLGTFIILDHIQSAPRAPACPMSTSAIGSRGRSGWPTRPGSGRWSGSAGTAGSGSSRVRCPCIRHAGSGFAEGLRPGGASATGQKRRNEANWVKNLGE